MNKKELSVGNQRVIVHRLWYLCSQRITVIERVLENDPDVNL